MQKLELPRFLLKALSKHLGIHFVMIELPGSNLSKSVDCLLLLGLVRNEELANMRIENPLLLCGGFLLGRDAQVQQVELVVTVLVHVQSLELLQEDQQTFLGREQLLLAEEVRVKH